MSKILLVDLDDRECAQADVDEEVDLVKQTIDDHHDKLELSSPLSHDP